MMRAIRIAANVTAAMRIYLYGFGSRAVIASTPNVGNL